MKENKILVLCQRKSGFDNLVRVENTIIPKLEKHVLDFFKNDFNEIKFEYMSPGISIDNNPENVDYLMTLGNNEKTLEFVKENKESYICVVLQTCPLIFMNEAFPYIYHLLKKDGIVLLISVNQNIQIKEINIHTDFGGSFEERFVPEFTSYFTEQKPSIFTKKSIKKLSIQTIFNLMFKTDSPVALFFKFLEITLGFTYDKDVGLIQVSYEQNLLFLQTNVDLISQLLQQFIQNNNEYLTFLFLFILCNNKNKIGEEIFNKWVEEIIGKLPIKLPIKLPTDIKSKKSNTLFFTGNSCYMDSALVALLLIPDQIIDETILNCDVSSLSNPLIYHDGSPADDDQEKLRNLQQELVKITLSLRGEKGSEIVKKVTNLRSLIKPLHPPQRFYKYGEQNESGEFITWLFDIFQVKNATLYQYNYYSNDRKNFIKVDEPNITKERPIIPITVTQLEKLDKSKKNFLTLFTKTTEITDLLDRFASKDEKTANFIKKKDPVTGITNRYRYRIQITKLVSPIYIFDVKRLGLNNRFNKTELIAPEFMFTKDYKKLELVSIVIHDGGAHYVCVFKYTDNKWYFYNDNPNSSGNPPIVRLLGSYKDMIKKSPYNPFKHGTVYFYKRNDKTIIKENLLTLQLYEGVPVLVSHLDEKFAAYLREECSIEVKTDIPPDGVCEGLDWYQQPEPNGKNYMLLYIKDYSQEETDQRAGGVKGFHPGMDLNEAIETFIDRCDHKQILSHPLFKSLEDFRVISQETVDRIWCNFRKNC